MNNKLCLTCVNKSELTSPEADRICDACEDGSKYIETLICKLKRENSELKELLNKSNCEIPISEKFEYFWDDFSKKFSGIFDIKQFAYEVWSSRNKEIKIINKICNDAVESYYKLTEKYNDLVDNKISLTENNCELIQNQRILLEALEEAIKGLQWWGERYNESVSSADSEVIDRFNAIINQVKRN